MNKVFTFVLHIENCCKCASDNITLLPKSAFTFYIVEFLFSSFPSPGTGDHSFERRLRLGGPLLKENIATMVLER